MSDTDRVIGALEEFKRSSEKRFDAFEGATQNRFDNVEKALESLKNFKIRVTAYAFVSVVIARLITDGIISAIAHVR